MTDSDVPLSHIKNILLYLIPQLVQKEDLIYILFKLLRKGLNLVNMIGIVENTDFF